MEVVATNPDLAERTRAHRLALARRLRDHLRDKTSDLAEGVLRIDPRIYVDEQRFKAMITAAVS